MRFVQNYSDIAAPLTELSRKQYKHDFQHYWKPQHDAAFTQLVQLLTSRPVLQLFHADRPIRIETDASDHGMGAVLVQDVSTNQWKPVEFWSKKFNSAQKNYHPAEKETCAIVYALQHWRHLLFGQQLSVITDNRASMYLQSKSSEQLSPRDQRWIAKLSYFAPFEVHYRPGPENITADYLSRQSSQDRQPIVRILDIDYIAVEIDHDARQVIQRVFANVSLDRPGLLSRTNIFRYGNDVRLLTDRRKLPPIDLVIAGVPCEPFSKANNSKDPPSYGLRDHRELFTSAHRLLERLGNPSYIIECTPFAGHLGADFQHISDMLGEPLLHDLAQCCPQRRVRYYCTSLPNPSELLPLQDLPVLWQDCLTPGSTVPTDELGQPITKCPALMASHKSHSDRSRSTWVQYPDGTLRPLQIQEKERLVGMEANDTAAAQVSEASRHRMCGNAFPVAWIANLLTAFLQNHTRTLQPLASRSHTPTVCVLRSPSKVAAMLTDSQVTPIIQRLQRAAISDSQYKAMVNSPPHHLQVRDGLLFDKPTANSFTSYDGPAVVWVPADDALRQDLLHLVHDQAHFGTARTYAAAKRHFRWKNMHNQIQHFVARCPTCQLQKPGTASRHQPYFPETAFYPYPIHTVVLDVLHRAGASSCERGPP
eukprot:scaffold34_cov337-Pavlova_lutheri.AAC.1